MCRISSRIDRPGTSAQIGCVPARLSAHFGLARPEKSTPYARKLLFFARSSVWRRHLQLAESFAVGAVVLTAPRTAGLGGVTVADSDFACIPLENGWLLPQKVNDVACKNGRTRCLLQQGFRRKRRMARRKAVGAALSACDQQLIEGGQVCTREKS